MSICNGHFTSESVSAGHPDKLADQISDAILDRFLVSDPQARVACETLVTDGLIVIAGEYATSNTATRAAIHSEAVAIARSVLQQAGYQDAETGIDPETCTVLVRLHSQSADIERGVMRDDGQIGAGDQGMMFGYATNETVSRIPLSLALAHQLVRRQTQVRTAGIVPWLGPDAKSQVTVRYDNGYPVEVAAIVLSSQHAAYVPIEEVRADILKYIVEPELVGYALAADFQVHINPTGAFVIGGPKGDTGLTGRKIIVDTYGGAAPHGGGAFSGKDPTKVDRSGAYAARYLANQVIARGWAERCLIQVAYAIGVAHPVSFAVHTFGTGQLSDGEIAMRLRDEFDLTPAGIIAHLSLRRPIYRDTAVFGHFGRTDVTFPWEVVT